MIHIQGDAAGYCPQEALDWARAIVADRKQRAENGKDGVTVDELHGCS
jgi:hypothetical protein